MRRIFVKFISFYQKFCEFYSQSVLTVPRFKLIITKNRKYLANSIKFATKKGVNYGKIQMGDR